MRLEEYLALFKKESNQTYCHSIRVGNLAMLTACALGFNEDTCKNYQMAGRYHDIGKVLDLEVVNSNIDFNSLPKEEAPIYYARTRVHVNVTILPIDDVVYPEYLDAMIYHHNFFNGTGYNGYFFEERNNPKLLKGDDIPQIAQILNVVDVYDGNRGERGYNNGGNSLEVTMSRVKGMLEDGLFNPYYADLVIHKIIPVFESLSKEEQLDLSMDYQNAKRLIQEFERKQNRMKNETKTVITHNQELSSGKQKMDDEERNSLR